MHELTQRLTASELIEWMAYDQLEPFGEGRLVLQQAMIMRQQAPRDSNIEIIDLVPYMRPEPVKHLSAEQQADLDRRMMKFFKAKAGLA